MLRKTTDVPIVLTIAGSDSSGGAGIQADLKTFAALGVYGASVITALTAQNTCGIAAVLPVNADFVAAQFQAVIGDLNVRTIKIGMLGNRAIVETVAGELKAATKRNHDGVVAPGVQNLDQNISIVLDPVMVASSGDVLSDKGTIDTLKNDLIPQADLITPNLPEAAKLLGQRQATTLEDMEDQACALLRLGPRAILLKGGHGGHLEAVDILYDGNTMSHFCLPRVDTTNTHGTGCTLSAAIASYLAQDRDLHDAIGLAKEFVWKALASGRNLKTGHGNGPLDHAYAQRN